MISALDNSKPIRESVNEYSQGIAGGLLFSFPLLYTMEVWWAGFVVPPNSILVLISLTFLLLLGYNRYAGMHPGSKWWEVVVDSVEELGLGFILSFGVLFMLNRIHFNMSIDEIMGKIVIEAMAVSIGVSVGTAQLGTGNGGGEERDEEHSERNKVALTVMALCGGIIVGANIAPTEEILMIAIEAEPLHILVMAIFSLLLSVLIVYFSNFKGSKKDRPDNFLYEFSFDTALCYVVALGASAFLLWFFGRFVNMSIWYIIAQCVVLGVLTSLGTSAGRLLIK